MLRIAATFLLVVSLGCEESDDSSDRKTPEPAAPLTEPAVLCRGATRGRPCRPVEQVEEWLADPRLEVLGAAEPPTGIQGARVMTLRVPELMPAVFRAKWRAQSTATKRNSPRRELAAYAVQKLFLDPDEYVVPPTAPHCFPLDSYRATVDPAATATWRGVPCVYGILSYWLEDVESLSAAREAGWFHGQHRHAFDPQLFADNAAYRDSVSRVNLLTYLIGHADSHAKNFVITSDSSTPLVYSVDNSLSLGLKKNPRLDAEHDWSQLKVPALPRSAVDRLRRLDDDDFASLGTVAELEPKNGQLVAAGRPRADASATGMGWERGRLRVGLTGAEIADVRVRVATLLRRIERGEIRLY